jgi:hypothetical protein
MRGICNCQDESRRTWYGRSRRGAYLEAGRTKKDGEERGEARKKKRAAARKRAGRRRRMWWWAHHDAAVDHMTAARRRYLREALDLIAGGVTATASTEVGPVRQGVGPTCNSGTTCHGWLSRSRGGVWKWSRVVVQ